MYKYKISCFLVKNDNNMLVAPGSAGMQLKSYQGYSEVILGKRGDDGCAALTTS